MTLASTDARQRQARARKDWMHMARLYFNLAEPSYTSSAQYQHLREMQQLAAENGLTDVPLLAFVNRLVAQHEFAQREAYGRTLGEEP